MLYRYAALPLLVVFAGLSLTGCGAESTAPAADPGPTAWRLSSAPAGAVDVAAAKTTARAGDTLALRGKIGGRMQPLTVESGLMVLMDRAIPSCADNPGDTCTTPWDYCCETPETLRANAATVQLRDADGNPVALPEGAFSALDELVVVGTVAPRANDETLVLHATGIHLAAELDAGVRGEHQP